MDRGKFWTARYAVINATYFMGFCGVHAYASIFMLGRGFTNSQIGMLLALANVLSVLIQPVIAGMIDKQGRLTNRRAALFSTAAIIVLSLVLSFVQREKAVIFIIFMLIYMIQMAYQPIIIAMNFEYAERGCSINFGLARGLGSVGFAVYSPILGNLLEQHSVSVIHMGDCLVLTVGLLFLLTFKMPAGCENSILRSGEERADREEKEQLVAHNNFFGFARHYPGFMLFLTSVILVFFAHNMINDYLIQIITPLGGTEKHIGYATSMAALIELPTMAFFARMTKKISCEKLLIISTVIFTVKVALLFLAGGIAGVFVSQFCQIGAYALFIPASAYYANIVMERLDQVKGQAYLNCAITLSGTFSGLICGRVLDLAGPKAMLAGGVCASALGTILAVLAVRKKKGVSFGCCN
ncbi:MFS transporter [Lachnospiraceae bacterium 38-10]